MKKILLLHFVILFSIISCSNENNGDKHIGVWQRFGKKEYIDIAKAGQKGYFLTTYTIYKDGFKNSYYCEYKEGCYYTKTNEKEVPVFCENKNKMIDLNGNMYTKIIKKNK